MRLPTCYAVPLQLSPAQEDSIAAAVRVLLKHIKRQQLQAETVVAATATAAGGCVAGQASATNGTAAIAAGGCVVAAPGQAGAVYGTAAAAAGGFAAAAFKAKFGAAGPSTRGGSNNGCAAGSACSPISNGTASADAAVDGSNGGSNGRTSGGSFGSADVTLRNRQRENADTQQRMMQLDQLLQQEAYVRIGLIWAMSSLSCKAGGNVLPLP